MGRIYRTKKTDTNQKDIVLALKQVPGLTVDVDHDDILVGYKGRNYWYEIKNPAVITKKGRPAKDRRRTQQKQEGLEETWRGHYKIVWSLDQILTELGITNG